MRCGRRRDRAFATVLARLTGTTATATLLTLVGRALATAILARFALVASAAVRSLGGSSPTIAGATTHNLDFAIRNLIGHRRNRGLLLRARGMAAARTRRALLLAARLAALFGRRIGSRGALGSGTGLASSCGTEGILALLARQVTAATARGVHATAAVLLLGLLSLALAGSVLVCGLAVVDGRRALAAATTTGGLLGLGCLVLTTALSAATALALALTGTGIGISITATALGH